MVDLNKFWTPKKIILMVFIVSISTFLLILSILFQNFFTKDSLLKMLFTSIGFLGLLSVILTIGVYYLATFIKYLRASNRIYFTTILSFGIVWAIFSALKEKSWLVLLGNFAWVGFAVTLERKITKKK